MQFIQDVCISSLFTPAIKQNVGRKAFVFDDTKLEKHSYKFKQKYNKEDATLLLQLCLSVSDTHITNKNINLPSYITNTIISYDHCPLEMISVGLKNSTLDKSAMIANILYNKNSNTLIIIFTGTANLCMASLDFKYTCVNYEYTNKVDGLKCHGGFYKIYTSVRKAIIETFRQYEYKKPQLIISGHSLGGALSQLCSLDLAYYNPIVYTFASPMAFNDIGYLVYTKLCKNTFRIANGADIITMSPLPIMPNNDIFYHTGELHYFQNNYGQYGKNHNIAYLEEYNLL